MHRQWLCNGLRLALAGVLLLGATAHAVAQTETGRVIGGFVDQTGGVLPGTSVTLTSVSTGAVRSTVSDSTGSFVFANVQPGQYDLEAELSGFTPKTARLVVNVGASVSVDTTLQVAGASEVITVVSESPVVNVVNSEISVTVREEQIRELPTLTRNPYDLVALAGNVNAATPDTVANGVERGAGFNINGQRASSTNILLDGSANNNDFDTTVGQQVPLDSVQEFSVISSNFSPQYGRASGGIVNVITKAGTNAFHGSAYEFFRSDKLSTNTVDNVANDIAKGEFSRNQMGFSMGGPLAKDKLQFFSNIEYTRVRSADTLISWVPTAEFLAASSQATRDYFAAYGGGAAINGPTLTRGDVSAILPAGTGAFSALPVDLPVFGQVRKSLPLNAGGGPPQDDTQWVARVDYSLSQNSQMYIRYALRNQNTQPGTVSVSPYSGYDTGSVNKAHNILGSFTHVWGPNFTSQTKVVYNRLNTEQPINGATQPTLYMNPGGPVLLQNYPIALPGYYPWSPGGVLPFGGPQKLLQLYQDQTWVKGNHDFRFGGSYVHVAADLTWGAFVNAAESLSLGSGSVLSSLDNFTLGQIAQFQAAINPNGYPGQTYTTPVPTPGYTSHNKYNEFALYVNDDWSIRNNVKLNLGLRYEYFGPQTKSEPRYDSNFYYTDPSVSVNWSSTTQVIDALRTGTVLPSNQSPIGQLWVSDWNNFAPRLGFAWDVNGDGKTSVRGGYGMSYERNFGNVTFNVIQNPPEYLTTQIQAPIDVATMPIYTNNLGPFGGIAGVTKTIPSGSLRHIDQNMTTAYAHFWSLSFQKEISKALNTSIEYSGSLGRNLYDLADPNKRGAPLVYEGVGTPTSRPNTTYTSFSTRGNRGRSQYHGVTFGMNSRNVADTGLQFDARYTLSRTMDNLSSTFAEGNGLYFSRAGYLDVFDPMLDWGYSEYDVRHRLVLSAIWNLPFFENAIGAKGLLGGWQASWIFTARSGYPFSVFDCTNNAFSGCMRALDPVGIDKNATGGAPTGNPNQYLLLDLAPILSSRGTYVNSVTGNSDFGPYPSTMTARDAFRGPGAWDMNFMLGKRFRFGPRALQARLEVYNLFNHANMFVNSSAANIGSFSTITGRKDGNRRAQVGFRFEF